MTHTTLHSKSFKPTSLPRVAEVLRDLIAATPLYILVTALKSFRTERSARSAKHHR
jgi:hypothetical protein